MRKWVSDTLFVTLRPPQYPATVFIRVKSRRLQGIATWREQRLVMARIKWLNDLQAFPSQNVQQNVDKRDEAWFFGMLNRYFKRNV